MFESERNSARDFALEVVSNLLVLPILSKLIAGPVRMLFCIYEALIVLEGGGELVAKRPTKSIGS